MPSRDPGADRRLTAVRVLEGKYITLVAAMARNRAIGVDGGLPWHLPRELAHFKSVTMGRAIVMGRRTWESIGRPLPGRQNIVITRQNDFAAEGVQTARSLSEAARLSDSAEVMVIGGGMLYAEALPVADRMVLTLVDCAPDADTWFPEWRAEEWWERSAREELPDERNPLAYRVIELTRRRGPGDTFRAPGTADRPPGESR